jgi:hypothetical protein
VSGGIDDVDPEGRAVPVPEARCSGGCNRDPPLLLLFHPVHRGGALVDLTDLVVLTGVVEDPLGRSRLPGIDVRHDADVPISIEGRLSRHVSPTANEKAGRPTGGSRGIAPRTSGLSPRTRTPSGPHALSFEDQR